MGDFNLVSNARIKAVVLGVVAGTGVPVLAKGCVIARTGAGVYTMTLSAGLSEADANESILLPTLLGGVAGSISVVHTSDTVKTISTFNAAGAATDQSWSAILVQVTPG